MLQASSVPHGLASSRERDAERVHLLFGYPALPQKARWPSCDTVDCGGTFGGTPTSFCGFAWLLLTFRSLELRGLTSLAEPTSSVGPDLHRGGRRFDPVRAHQESPDKLAFYRIHPSRLPSPAQLLVGLLESSRFGHNPSGICCLDLQIRETRRCRARICKISGPNCTPRRCNSETQALLLNVALRMCSAILQALQILCQVGRS